MIGVVLTSIVAELKTREGYAPPPPLTIYGSGDWRLPPVVIMQSYYILMKNTCKSDFRWWWYGVVKILSGKFEN